MVKHTRDIIEEIGKELLDLFKQGKYRTFMNRCWQTKFDVAAHFQNIKEPFLHVAARENHVELIEFLLRRNFKVNNRDFEGRTPLHYAMWAKNGIEAADVLILNGADVNLRSSDGLTPLHTAVFWDNLDHVRYLVTRGARLDLVDDTGLTPAELTALKNNGENPLRDYFQNSIDLFMDQYQAYKHDKADNIADFCDAPQKWNTKEFAPYSGAMVFAQEGRFDDLAKHLIKKDPAALRHLGMCNEDRLLEVLCATGQIKMLINQNLWAGHSQKFNRFLNNLMQAPLDQYFPQHSEKLYSLQTILMLDKTTSIKNKPLKRRQPKPPGFK